MSQELHYTSVPRGLLPGTRGFCTVACTPNMSGPLRERLESLSGYQQVYPPHDPKVGLNPVVFSHHRLNLGGRSYSVLSRVCFAGLDYTSRSNKYAHHVVLDPAERPAGGPAWLLGQPGFMEPIWQGEPRFIAAGRTPPQGDQPAGIAHAWQSLTGDAGWAGTLAESFQADPRRPAFLIFEPGMDLLPLLVEALALLPPENRWEVEFSTYFTQLPQGLSCAWRGVLEGTAEAKKAIRLPNALLIRLEQSARRAGGADLVHLARTGQRLERSAEEVALQRGPTAPASRASTVAQNRPGITPSVEFLSITGAAAPYDVLPSFSTQESTRREVEGRSGRRTSPESVIDRRTLLLSALATSLFLLVSAAVVWKWLESGTNSSAIVAAALKGVTELKEKHASETTGEIKAQGEASSKSPATTEREVRKSNDVSDRKEGVAKTIPSVPTNPIPVNPPPTRSEKKEAATQPLHPPKQYVRYWALPMIPSALFDLTAANSSAGGSPKIELGETIESISFIPWDSDVKTKSSKGKISLSTLASFGENVPIADISLQDSGLTFEWGEKQKETRFARIIEDSALIARASGGNTYTVFFRDLGIKTPAPFPPFQITATPEENKKGDTRSKRSTYIPWCKPRALEGSKWDLVIRYWQIESRVTGPKLELIAKGSGNSNLITEDILPDRRAILTLEIPKDQPHQIKLNMSLDYDKSKSDKLQLEKLEKDIKRLEDKEDMTRSDGQDELNNLRQEKDRFKHYVYIFGHIYKSHETNLSITIGVNINNQDLDAARFGSIPDPHH